MVIFLNLGIFVGFVKLVLYYLDVEFDKGVLCIDWFVCLLSEI